MQSSLYVSTVTRPLQATLSAVTSAPPSLLDPRDSPRGAFRCDLTDLPCSCVLVLARPSSVLDCAVRVGVVFGLCCGFRRILCVSFITQRLDSGSTPSILHCLVINISTSSFFSPIHLCLTPSSTPAHTLIDTPHSRIQSGNYIIVNDSDRPWERKHRSLSFAVLCLGFLAR